MEVETDDIPEFLLSTMYAAMPLRFQIAVWRETPTSFGCVRPGGGWVTFTMICSTVSMGTHGLRPRPALSFKPSRPACWKRLDHLLTHGKLTFNRSATSSTLTPSLRSRTISARKLSRFELVLELTRRSLDVHGCELEDCNRTGHALYYSIESDSTLRI